MDFKINDINIPKAELLQLIENNKLQAIVFIRNIVPIGLKDAKTIVDNIEENPDFYDTNNLKVKVKGTARIDRLPIDSEKHKKRNQSKSLDRKKGPHVIKSKSNTKIYFILIGLIIIALMSLYYLSL